MRPEFFGGSNRTNPGIERETNSEGVSKGWLPHPRRRGRWRTSSRRFYLLFESSFSWRNPESCEKRKHYHLLVRLFGVVRLLKGPRGIIKPSCDGWRWWQVGPAFLECSRRRDSTRHVSASVDPGAGSIVQWLPTSQVGPHLLFTAVAKKISRESQVKFQIFNI